VAGEKLSPVIVGALKKFVAERKPSQQDGRRLFSGSMMLATDSFPKRSHIWDAIIPPDERFERLRRNV